MTGGETCTIITAPRKGERYKCSVQARNRCRILSNHSNSIEISVPGKWSNIKLFFLTYIMKYSGIEDDIVSVSSKTTIAAVIVGIVLTVATVLILTTTAAICCTLFSQHKRYGYLC